MQERRKQPRKDLMSYSQVFDVQTGSLIGYLGDLTPSGAMVISDSMIEPNSPLTISIQLPELDSFSETAITLQIRVAWCKQDLSPEYYNLGLEFKSLSEKEKKIVEAVIEKYEFRRQTPHYPPHPSQLND